MRDFLLPSGHWWRNLYIPKAATVGGTLIPDLAGGADLTLTNGAAIRTTSDGVHFVGTATSNCVIPAHADNNNKAAIAITIRFKFDTGFDIGEATDQYIFNKVLGNEWVRLRFESDDGALYFEQGNGAGGNQFQLVSTTVDWGVGWHVVTASLTDTPTQRLLVDNVAEDTDTQAARATPNGGDVVVGSSSDGGADGFEGTIAYVHIATGATAATALTAAEETLLYKGIPPAIAKSQYLMTMDEGRSVTTYNRGGGTGNGTLDSACSWDNPTPHLACMSLDGINDYAVSGQLVNAAGDITIVWAGKIMSTCDADVSKGLSMFYAYKVPDEAGNRLWLAHATSVSGLRFWVDAGGVTDSMNYSTAFTIGDYAILVCTYDETNDLAQFAVNGVVVATDTGLGVKSALLWRLWLGKQGSSIATDVSKPILSGLINGALTSQEARLLTHRISQRYELGVM